jgi:rhamnose transport system ATP-binding protein
MIYISHRLEELPLIADRVTVLRDGVTVDTREMRAVNREQLIQLMVGRELSAVFPKRIVTVGETTLELRDVCCSESGVSNVTLSARAGEIVGIAGLVGAGRTELARTIFGLTPADGGEIRVRGQPATIRSPTDAIALGIAYVPEDRRRHGVILPMSIASNVTLAALDETCGEGAMSAIDFAEENRIAADLSRRLGVKTPSIHTTVDALSGGNQQKVALARWLVRRPSVLILDEPTQGIDVGAKSEIHALMVQLADEGVAIIMISSELPEILGMSDRIVVMHQGTVVDTVNRSDATQERILTSALGHASERPHLALAGAR